MIGSVSDSYPALVPGDQRERSPQASDPAPYKVEGRADVRHTQPYGSPGPVAPEGEEFQPSEHSDAFHQYRVEARLQAQAARLEKDEAAVLPRQKQQALQVYGAIANTRQESGVELVGLDLRV